MRGLIIAEPWIDLILDGSKTWELRTRNVKFRQTIALIRKGSGRIVGTARLVDALGPMTHAQLLAHEDKHRVPPEILADYVGPAGAFVWVLDGASRLAKPVSYEHRSGAVIWVTLPDDILQASGVTSTSI